MTTPRKPMPFPLSKCMDPADIMELEQEHQTIVSYDAMIGQHEARWWEYAMAHRAIQEWRSARDNPPLEYLEGSVSPLQLADVGGAGSRFVESLTALTSEDIALIDPALDWDAPRGRIYPFAQTVEQYAATAAHSQLDCITAISVVEHLDAVRPFLRACYMLLKPGGLLFLTTDCWNREGPDVAHFHWMRKRIYNPETMGRLATNHCRDVGFRTFGRTEWTYHGDTVYDYTFASLAQVKR